MSRSTWAAFVVVMFLSGYAAAGDRFALPTGATIGVGDSRWMNVTGDWMTGTLGADAGFVSPQQNVLGPVTATRVGVSGVTVLDGGLVSPQQNALGPTVVTGVARTTQGLSTDGGFSVGGTTTLNGPVHVGGGTQNTGVALDVAAVTGLPTLEFLTTATDDGSGSGLYLRTTHTAEYGVVNGGTLGQIPFGGWEGTGWVYPVIALVEVDGTVSSSTVPGKFSILTGSQITASGNPGYRRPKLVIPSYGPVVLPAYGVATGTTGSLTLGELAANGGLGVTIRAPDDVTAYTLTVPPAAPAYAGSVIATSTAGVQSWSPITTYGDYVGIGMGATAPCAALDVVGSAWVGNNNCYAGFPPATGQLVVANQGGSPRIVLFSSGTTLYSSLTQDWASGEARYYSELYGHRIYSNASASGLNSYFYNGANAGGEYGPAIGTSGTATAQTIVTFARGLGIGETPVHLVTISGSGAIRQIATVSTLPTCDATSFGTEVMLDKGADAGSFKSKCVCEQTGEFTYAWGAATATGVCT